MSRQASIIAMLLCIACVFFGPRAGAQTSVIYTKHNLSKYGPGTIKALTEERVCVFCHAPHNANPLTPLWNKNIEGVNYSLYTPYTSSTMVSPPPSEGPTGATRLCLSCHDGTIALGAVLQPSEQISMTVAGGLPPTSPSYIGTSLESHHPVSFSYYDSLPNTELAPAPPAEFLFYGNGIMQCSTCHDAHDNSNKKFLAVSNVRSGLCATCHMMNGWVNTPHNTSLATWNLLPPDPWPRTGAGTEFGWTTVIENGCENCHAPHSAGGQKRLLNYLEEENNCYPCHNGNVATANIQAQFAKSSRHRVEAATIGVTSDHHEAKESPVQVTGHVECADCHNPHAANSQTVATPPAVSGKLEKVSGVDIYGTGITPPNYAQYEYEICFKCHASSSAQSTFDPIPRVINNFNARVEFETSNPSTHFVVGTGPVAIDVPSIPSADEPTLTSSSIIYCTDCHDSDESRSIGGPGPRGPHGSRWSPLLRQQYVTVTPTSYQSQYYALCYRCHNETSILSDISFQKNSSNFGGHSGHLTSTGPAGTAVNAPCSVCHDPHGVPDDGLSGSHKRLINFDTRSVSAAPGFSVPVFAGSGNRAGNCALVCHDAGGNPVVHDGSATFSYGGHPEIGFGSVELGW
jgi:predicted CXXCH cytochrome family protein